MTTNRSTTDGPARRTIEPRSWPRPPGLALIGLALFGLVQAGCRSDGCSTCGLGIGNSISNGVQALGNGVRSVGSIFHHKKGCGGGGDCGCGGGIEEGVVVEQGIPVVPGGMSVPVVPAPGTIVTPPSLESEPLNLKALPDQPANPTSGTGTGTGGSGAKPTTSRSTPAGTTRSNYTTSLPRSGTLASKGREADQALGKTSNRLTVPSDTADLLENIPPVDLSSEATRKAVTSPTSTPSPAASSSTPVTPAPAEKISAADGGGPITLPSIEAVTAPQAPGLRRYSSIAPASLAGRPLRSKA